MAATAVFKAATSARSFMSSSSALSRAFSAARSAFECWDVAGVELVGGTGLDDAEEGILGASGTGGADGGNSSLCCSVFILES